MALDASHNGLWPIPDSIPRQKAYTYLFLIGMTALLLYFYSYPLNTENWNNFKQTFSNDIYRGETKKDSTSSSYKTSTANSWNPYESTIFQNLFGKSNAASVKNRQLKTTNIFQSENTNLPLESVQNKDNIPTKSIVTESDNFEEELVYVTRRKIEKSWKDEVRFTLADDETIHINNAQNDAKTVREITVSGKEKSVLSTTSDTVSTSFNTNQKDEDEHFTGSPTHTSLTHQNTTITYTTESARITQYENLKSKTDYSDLEDASSEISSHFESTPQSSKSLPTTQNSQENSFLSTETARNFSDIHKGYLVFSEHCRIPDLDPMHPSIVHLIKKTPPLDCSEKYQPLTKTEGYVILVNNSAALKRTGGKNYTCCYRSVFRKNDEHSDNGVGFGKECIKISDQVKVEDEFVMAECEYDNGTTFYIEFHSFIFDKEDVEKRCRKDNKPEYSVLIIGVDAVSRLNMHRQLNATATYLLKEMGATEMYGFNKVGDNTFPNLMPLLTGYDERELPSVCWESNDLPLDDCEFLWKTYAEKGYRTLYAEDSPHISSFNYVKKGFYRQPTDYYFRPFILAYEDALGRDKPLNCYKCVGSVSETEAVLHWTEQFTSHFSGRPSFSFSWINSLTHDFLNMGSSADHMYERFFRTLHQSGALNKTIVILMGDHGMRWGSIRNTYVGRLEERLPMLLIALPQHFKQNYPEFTKTLNENSHRLVTPFDLHATLVHLLDLRSEWTFGNERNISEELSNNFSRRAMSLFQPVPVDRSCDEAFIEEHWCTCETSIEVDVHSVEVKQVARYLLDKINNLLNPVSDKCALLTLASISDARLWQPPKEHRGHSADDDIYTVVIHANPSEAVFEGTVKISNLKTGSELLGTISRLNLYGNQSLCVDDAILKKYCYCL